MSTRQSKRTLHNIGKIMTAAVSGAEQNPLTTNLDSGELYVGDMFSLALVAKELYGGKRSWATDMSEYGARLRDIAAALAGGQQVTSEIPDDWDSERRYARSTQIDRHTIAVIAWIVVGKSLKEALAEATAT
jgi:hypothetical protein